MEQEDRQFLLTIAWLFAQHGQNYRARTICEALVEDMPEDGVSAIALAQFLLDDGEAEPALKILREAQYPSNLARAEAMLETRALSLLGRKEESMKRWKRFLASSNGANRTWIDG